MKLSSNASQISKYLSYILRHKPDSIGLKLDEEGWADIDEIISKTEEFILTKEMIGQIVEESEKQRFDISDNKIRANQGHSINIDLALAPTKPPTILYHGTAIRFLSSIMSKGILSQERQHVHLSSKREDALTVGERHGKAVVLMIDAAQMYHDGYLFYLSKNGVWLTEEVLTKYIREEE